MGVRAAPPKKACLLVGERLDDLVGDVDPRARKHHRILQDQVELLLLGNLLDDLSLDSFWMSASRPANSFSSFCCARFAGTASRNSRSVFTNPIL
jgi:hypothetical protein